MVAGVTQLPEPKLRRISAMRDQELETLQLCASRLAVVSVNRLVIGFYIQHHVVVGEHWSRQIAFT